MRKPPKTIKGERLLTSGEVCHILNIKMRRLHWFAEAGLVEAPVVSGKAQARYRNWDKRSIYLLAAVMTLKDDVGVNIEALRHHARLIRRDPAFFEKAEITVYLQTGKGKVPAAHAVIDLKRLRATVDIGLTALKGQRQNG